MFSAMGKVARTNRERHEACINHPNYKPIAPSKDIKEEVNKVTKEATCAATGTTTYTCEKCGKTYTEKIPKTDHSFIVTEKVIGTCIEKGYRVETCTECGLSQTIEGIYGDHDLWVNGEQIEPTCEDPGLKTEQCKVCFEIFTTELPALGHEFETTPTIDSEAYCMMSGEKSNHCIRCDERKNAFCYPCRQGRILFKRQCLFR